MANTQNEINEFEEQFMSGFNSPEDLQNDFKAFAKAAAGTIDLLKADRPITLHWKATRTIIQLSADSSANTSGSSKKVKSLFGDPGQIKPATFTISSFTHAKG